MPIESKNVSSYNAEGRQLLCLHTLLLFSLEFPHHITYLPLNIWFHLIHSSHPNKQLHVNKRMIKNPLHQFNKHFKHFFFSIKPQCMGLWTCVMDKQSSKCKFSKYRLGNVSNEFANSSVSWH